MNRKQNWYLVVNTENTVLAVYGSALANDAQAKARELSQLGTVALRLAATAKRPRVGTPAPVRTLSMTF